MKFKKYCLKFWPLSKAECGRGGLRQHHGEGRDVVNHDLDREPPGVNHRNWRSQLDAASGVNEAASCCTPGDDFLAWWRPPAPEYISCKSLLGRDAFGSAPLLVYINKNFAPPPSWNLGWQNVISQPPVSDLWVRNQILFVFCQLKFQEGGPAKFLFTPQKVRAHQIFEFGTLLNMNVEQRADMELQASPLTVTPVTVTFLLQWHSGYSDSFLIHKSRISFYWKSRLYSDIPLTV